MTELPHTQLFGRARVTGTQGEHFYKLLGHGSRDYYKMALELTDFSTAFVAKFSLQDVEKAMDKEGETKPNELAGLLDWLMEAFGGGRPVEVEEHRGSLMLVGGHPHPANPQTLISLRLPPRGSMLHQVNPGPGFEWVCKDLTSSLLDAYHKCQEKLEQCVKDKAPQQQVLSIMQFIREHEHPSSPSKRKEPEGVSPAVDQGSAMKARPAGVVGGAASGGRGDDAEQPGGPAVSEQPTLGTVGTAGASQSTAQGGSQHSRPGAAQQAKHRAGMGAGRGRQLGVLRKEKNK